MYSIVFLFYFSSEYRGVCFPCIMWHDFVGVNDVAIFTAAPLVLVGE
jgi:hypothetical protein